MSRIGELIHFPESKAMRELPHAEDAEVALLGAILLAPSALAHVQGWLLPEHFHIGAHGRIYEAALHMAARGTPGTAEILSHYFADDEDLKDVGGRGYLRKLALSTVTVIGAAHYGRTILECAARRRLIEIGNALIEASFAAKADTDASKLAADAAAELEEVAASLAAMERAPDHIAAAAEVALEQTAAAHRLGSHVTGITSGLRDLDDLTGGLHPGELNILAARPAMGKTALALVMAMAAAATKPVAFFSLEMPSVQLAQRALAMLTGIGSDLQRKGTLNVGEFGKLEAARRDLEALPLSLIDANGWGMGKIGATAKRLHHRKPLGLIVVDYLQLIAGSEARGGFQTREQVVSEIARGLKGLARALGIPVLALAQLSRSLEAREDKRPRMSDLRESGAIEQDADVIMFIHRAAEYMKREAPEKDAPEFPEWERKFNEANAWADLIVDKQRMGPTDSLKLRYSPKRTAFYDAPRKGEPPPRDQQELVL